MRMNLIDKCNNWRYLLRLNGKNKYFVHLMPHEKKVVFLSIFILSIRRSSRELHNKKGSISTQSLNILWNSYSHLPNIPKPWFIYHSIFTLNFWDFFHLISCYFLLFDSQFWNKHLAMPNSLKNWDWNWNGLWILIAMLIISLDLDG